VGAVVIALIRAEDAAQKPVTRVAQGERQADHGSMTRVLLCLSLIVGAAPLAAQVNIEALRRDTLPPGLSGALRATFAVKSGNVDLVQLALAGRSDLVAGRMALFVVGNTSIGFLDSTRFLSAGLVHVRQSYAVRPWLLPEWFAQVNYDEPRLLNIRGLVGGGVRVQVANSGPARLWIGTGIMYEHERLDLPSGAVHPARVSVVRSSSYGALRLRAAPNLALTMTTYLQPQLSQPEDLRVIHNLALSVAVTRAIAVTISLDLRYDSRPPDGIDTTDLDLESGLMVRF